MRITDLIRLSQLRFRRYEFAQNEFVTCVDCIPLESASTEAGIKDFIAVGTTINRGEDLAVKGAVSHTYSWNGF